MSYVEYITLAFPHICFSSTVWPWSWRHCDPSKRWAIPNDAVSQARTPTFPGPLLWESQIPYKIPSSFLKMAFDPPSI